MRPLFIECPDGSRIQVQDVPPEVKQSLARQEVTQRRITNARYRGHLIGEGLIKPFRYHRDAPNHLYEAKWERDLTIPVLPIDPEDRYYQESLKTEYQEGAYQ